MRISDWSSDVCSSDLKINLLVEEVAALTTPVVPGQANAVTTFQLTNMSNESLDFALVAAQIAGGTASHGGTDSFNANNVRIYRDNSSSGTIGSWAAGDTLITRSEVRRVGQEGVSTF